MALLQDCPETVALVTSRFVLQVQGEQEFPVPPLGLSPREPGDGTVSDAVELFLERARSVLPSFDPTARELEYVGEICRRLDGLPLAIEWAAARVKIFPPRALWERLAGRFDLLGSPGRSAARNAGLLRHRTLHEAIAWSAELLAEEEAVLLRRLAVFVGGFPLSAVEAVCRPEESEANDGVELLTAQVAEAVGNAEDAETGFVKAYEIWRSIESVWGTAFGACLLGKHRQKAGDPEGARELYREAAELAERWDLGGLDFGREGSGEPPGR